MLAVITLLWGRILSERTNDVSNSFSDLPRRMSIVSGSIDMGLDVWDRTTDFLRSAVELIAMRSPVGAASDVLHHAPQRSGELGVLREHGANHAEECSDIAGESRGGSSGRRVELYKRGVWGIVGGRGVGRWNFLDIDCSIGGEWEIVTRNFVDVNRRFLWGVVGEDGVGRRGGVRLARFALVSQCRCESPGKCGGSVSGHAGAETGISADLRKLELVPGSGTNLAAVKGVEPRNPLPIVIDNVLVERDGSKRVVGWSLAEPVRDRRGVREGLLVEASNYAEVHDRETSKQGIRIGSVIIFELLLGTKGDFITVGVGIGHSDVLNRDTVKRLELCRYFEPGRKLSEGDTTGYTVFSELELNRRGHGWG